MKNNVTAATMIFEGNANENFKSEYTLMQMVKEQNPLVADSSFFMDLFSVFFTYSFFIDFVIEIWSPTRFYTQFIDK